MKLGTRLLTLWVLFQSEVILAASKSYGSMARGVMGPLDAIIHLLRAICIVTGIGLVMGGLVKFSDYRRNPNEISIGVPIGMIIAGLALIGLGFIPMLRYK